MFNESTLNKSDYIFIDPLGLHMEVLKKIISCKYIISNSLHGLIISDAYNVPNVWLNIQIECDLRNEIQLVERIEREVHPMLNIPTTPSTYQK